MFTLRFYPESNLAGFSEAVKEYENIWQQEGERIVNAWEKFTGLKFTETYINAIVFDGISHSHPLSLRFNLETERKKSTLIHELGHRILYKKIKDGRNATSLETHKVLFLVLYDLLIELYGNDFAARTVEWDSNLPRPQYKEAWDWALAMTQEERRLKFKEILEKGYSIIMN